MLVMDLGRIKENQPEKIQQINVILSKMVLNEKTAE